MQEMEWLPIDEVDIEIVGDIPLIRNATGTPVLSTDREPVWEDWLSSYCAFLVREKLSVYVHNCVIDDFSILKFIKKFLFLLKWVSYKLYYVF